MGMFILAVPNIAITIASAIFLSKALRDLVWQQSDGAAKKAAFR